MSELEDLRKKRMAQLMQQQTQPQMQQQMQHQLQEEQVDSQIGLIIRKILAPDARERLGNIRAAMPEFARQIEVVLIQLYQSGRLPTHLTDVQFKEILVKLRGERREIKIKK